MYLSKYIPLIRGKLKQKFIDNHANYVLAISEVNCQNMFFPEDCNCTGQYDLYIFWMMLIVSALVWKFCMYILEKWTLENLVALDLINKDNVSDESE